MRFAERLQKCNLNIDNLRNAKVMITGATGLIGKTAALCLMNLSREYGLGIRLVLVVRDANKLDAELKTAPMEQVTVVRSDIIDFKGIDLAVDYIIHGASITSSKAFVENPVEVIMTNIVGTKNVLEFAKRSGVKSVVYLSSMEAYGFTSEEIELTEDRIQYLDPLAVRSSYPESKRMAENLCVSYCSEYGIPIKIVRLAQTFGKGVRSDDGRVFAEFARNAVEKKNIVLLTDGKSKRMYLDVEDAVTGILVALFKGENGSAYNIANKNSYCSIYDMAQLVAKTIGHSEITVKYHIGTEDTKKFSPPHKYYLNVSKIEKLGWRACTELEDMYGEMVEGWLQQK